jgi:hypothetical protein
MKYTPVLSLLLLFIIRLGIAQTAGEKTTLYLNQEPPGLAPKIFAPEVVSLKNRYEFGSVFSRNGKEFYYAVEAGQRPHIEFIKYENNQWSAPVKLLFSDKYGYNDPFLSPDEKKLFFISDQALDGQGDKKDIDIWYVQREKNGWSKPINAGKEINSAHNEYYISFTKRGTMYYSSNKQAPDINSKAFDIYSSPSTKGTFQASTKLSPAVNSAHYEADVFISPDESYIIYCSERPGGNGAGDLFISFKNSKGDWSEAKNMGKTINSSGYEFCPFVTADGKYLFFSRDGDIYWVDAQVIQELKSTVELFK